MQKRILIIKNEEDLHLLLKDIFEKQAEDYQVVVAPDIPALINLLLRLPFNLVLIDRQAGSLGWLKQAQLIRGFWPDSTILLLVEKDIDPCSGPEQSWAFDAFIQKPFSPEQLLNAVERLLIRQN